MNFKNFLKICPKSFQQTTFKRVRYTFLPLTNIYFFLTALFDTIYLQLLQIKTVKEAKVLHSFHFQNPATNKDLIIYFVNNALSYNENHSFISISSLQEKFKSIPYRTMGVW